MTLRLGSIRLLPITIFALAGLLAMKSAQLVRAAVPVAGCHTSGCYGSPGRYPGSDAARGDKAV